MSLFESDEEDERVRSYFEGAMRLMHPERSFEFDKKKQQYKEPALNMFWLGFAFSLKFHGVKPENRNWGGGDPYQDMVHVEIKKPHLKLVE